MSIADDGFVFGVVEGFYGQPWSMAHRRELFAHQRQWGMNTYMYAPKDDLKHRKIWRVPYLNEDLEHLRSLIEDARASGIEFVFAISPGLDMVMSSEGDLLALQAKLDQLAKLGCTSFAVLFDDIPARLSPEDAAAFSSLAQAQTHVANTVFAHLSPKRMMFCPTEYCESRAQPSVEESAYLRVLGAELHPHIAVMWTGPSVVSADISVNGIARLGEVLKRKPLIWDNLHSNDYDSKQVFLGPYQGRAWELRENISGVLSNPNCEFSLNFVPLHTMASWINHGPAYDVQAALTSAATDWLQRIHHGEEGEKVLLEDVLLLIDCFYLPVKQSQAATDFLENFRWLETNLPIVDGWLERAEAFSLVCRRASEVFDRLASLSQKVVFFELYPYIAELRDLMIQYEVAVQLLSVHTERSIDADQPPALSDLGGGFLAQLVGLLPMNRESSLFSKPRGVPSKALQKAGASSQHFEVRPFCSSDDDGVYNVCLKTGNAGKDASEIYKSSPRALGDRWVGAYCHLPGCGAFVLQDEKGVCGYVLGAVDSISFYEKLTSEWLPKVRAAYTRPEQRDASLWSQEETFIEELYEPHYIVHKDLILRYPSHLHIDLLERAQRQGNGKQMISRILDFLSEKGSIGVHLEMNRKNHGAREFYAKLGFHEIQLAVQLGEDQPLYLGKALP